MSTNAELLKLLPEMADLPRDPEFLEPFVQSALADLKPYMIGFEQDIYNTFLIVVRQLKARRSEAFRVWKNSLPRCSRADCGHDLYFLQYDDSACDSCFPGGPGSFHDDEIPPVSVGGHVYCSSGCAQLDGVGEL